MTHRDEYFLAFAIIGLMTVLGIESICNTRNRVATHRLLETTMRAYMIEDATANRKIAGACQESLEVAVSALDDMKRKKKRRAKR